MFSDWPSRDVSDSLWIYPDSAFWKEQPEWWRPVYRLRSWPNGDSREQTNSSVWRVNEEGLRWHGEYIHIDRTSNTLHLWAWGKDVDVDAVRNIFDIFTTFEFNFIASRRGVELGIEYPAEGPDAHPNEDWDVFFGPVEMFMLDDNLDGFIINQNMTFKLRKDSTSGLYTIIRWITHPSRSAAARRYGADGRLVSEADTWGRIKATFLGYFEYSSSD